VPEEKITVEEALRAYTATNAYALFADGKRGRLRPGLLADFAVLDRDLFRIPAPEIDQAKVIATVVGGKVVYRTP
jgi:predicted amidohydrolase YtcJ